jgi:hypothetical protein
MIYELTLFILDCGSIFEEKTPLEAHDEGGLLHSLLLRPTSPTSPHVK